jgi:hypothetical protein
MKRTIKLFAIVAVFAFFTACSDQPDAKTKDSANDKSSDTECIYTLINDSSAVNWTAFKTNERIGVGGHFDEIKVWTPDNAISPKNILIGTSFDIITTSVNTGNTERDPKLIKYFFTTLTDGHIIKGEIISAKGNSSTGEGMIKMMFNGITNKIPYSYQIKENKIILKTGINLDEWDGANAVKTLNAECYDLHTGKDGVSKLWPDVEIQVIAQFKKDC